MLPDMMLQGCGVIVIVSGLLPGPHLDLRLIPVASLEKSRQIALDAGIKYAYIGNVPGHLGENTYCPKCKKMIIERKGRRCRNSRDRLQSLQLYV